MRLSYSAINTYLNCPLRYRFTYVEGRERLPAPALSFGGSVHAALEWLYSVPTPDPPPLADLLAHLESCWQSEGYESPGEEARYYLQARSTLELYYRNHVANNPSGFQVPAALEHKFAVDLGFCELSGVIDRMDRDDASGGFEIIDYKTNRRLPPARRLREDLQLPLYQVAVGRIWEAPVSRVTFHYLMMDHRASFFISPEREAEALEKVRDVAGRIERAEFEPRGNNLCPWCDFTSECPVTAARPVHRRRPEPPPLDVGQAVDEIIRVRGRVSSGLSLLEGLEMHVSSYLASRGLETVGGSLGCAFIDEQGCLSVSEEEPRLF